METKVVTTNSTYPQLDGYDIYRDAINTVFYIIYLPVAFIGNLFTVIIVTYIVRHQRTRRSIPDLCLGLLALVDLFSVIFIHFPSAIAEGRGYFRLAKTLCSYQAFCISVYFKLQFLMQILICLDRHFALVRPLKYRRFSSLKNLRIVLLLIISFTFATSGLTLILSLSVYSNQQSIHVLETWAICAFTWHLFTTIDYVLSAVMILISVSGFIAFIVCNIALVKLLWHYHKHKTTMVWREITKAVEEIHKPIYSKSPRKTPNPLPLPQQQPNHTTNTLPAGERNNSLSLKGTQANCIEQKRIAIEKRNSLPIKAMPTQLNGQVNHYLCISKRAVSCEPAPSVNCQNNAGSNHVDHNSQFNNAQTSEELLTFEQSNNQNESNTPFGEEEVKEQTSHNMCSNQFTAETTTGISKHSDAVMTSEVHQQSNNLVCHNTQVRSNNNARGSLLNPSSIDQASTDQQHKPLEINDNVFENNDAAKVDENIQNEDILMAIELQELDSQTGLCQQPDAKVPLNGLLKNNPRNAVDSEGEELHGEVFHEAVKITVSDDPLAMCTVVIAEGNVFPAKNTTAAGQMNEQVKSSTKPITAQLDSALHSEAAVMSRELEQDLATKMVAPLKTRLPDANDLIHLNPIIHRPSASSLCSNTSKSSSGKLKKSVSFILEPNQAGNNSDMTKNSKVENSVKSLEDAHKKFMENNVYYKCSVSSNSSASNKGAIAFEVNNCSKMTPPTPDIIIDYASNDDLSNNHLNSTYPPINHSQPDLITQPYNNIGSYTTQPEKHYNGSTGSSSLKPGGNNSSARVGSTNLEENVFNFSQQSIHSYRAMSQQETLHHFHHQVQKVLKKMHKNTRKQRREIFLARIVLLCAAIFIISWVPYTVFIIFSMVGGHANPILEDLAMRCIFLNAVFNPIFYGLCRKNYRKGYDYVSQACCHFISCGMIDLPSDDKVFFESRQRKQNKLRDQVRRNKELRKEVRRHHEQSPKHRNSRADIRRNSKPAMHVLQQTLILRSNSPRPLSDQNHLSPYDSPAKSPHSPQVCLSEFKPSRHLEDLFQRYMEETDSSEDSSASSIDYEALDCNDEVMYNNLKHVISMCLGADKMDYEQEHISGAHPSYNNGYARSVSREHDEIEEDLDRDHDDIELDVDYDALIDVSSENVQCLLSSTSTPNQALSEAELGNLDSHKRYKHSQKYKLGLPTTSYLRQQSCPAKTNNPTITDSDQEVFL